MTTEPTPRPSQIEQLETSANARAKLRDEVIGFDPQQGRAARRQQRLTPEDQITPAERFIEFEEQALDIFGDKVSDVFITGGTRAFAGVFNTQQELSTIALEMAERKDELDLQRRFGESFVKGDQQILDAAFNVLTLGRGTLPPIQSDIDFLAENEQKFSIEFDIKYQALAQESLRVNQELGRLDFKHKYWLSLPPMWRNGDWTTFDQSLDAFAQMMLVRPAEANAEATPATEILTADDIEELRVWFQDISAATVQIPGVHKLTELREAFEVRARPNVVYLDTLTTEEIIRNLGAISVPDQIPGLSPEQVLALLADFGGGDSDLQKELEDSRFYVQNLAQQYTAERQMRQAILAGLIDPTLPKMTSLQYMNFAAAQPALFLTAEVLETFFSHVTTPWVSRLTRTKTLPIALGVQGAGIGLLAGGAIGGRFGVAGSGARIGATIGGAIGAAIGGVAVAKYSGELGRLYEESLQSQESSWLAEGEAWANWDQNTFLKIGLETFADPTTLFGTGVFIKATAKVPLLSRTLGRFEQVFNSVTGAAIRAVLPAHTGVIPLLGGGLSGILVYNETGNVPLSVAAGVVGMKFAGTLYAKVPKTINQAGSTYGKEGLSLMLALSSDNVAAVAGISNPTLAHIPVQTMRETAIMATAAHIADPGFGPAYNKIARMGKFIFDSGHKWLTGNDLKPLMSQLFTDDPILGAASPLIQAQKRVGTKANLTLVNNYLHWLRGDEVKVISKNETIAKLAAFLGGNKGTARERLGIVRDWVHTWRQETYERGMKPLFDTTEPRIAATGFGNQIRDTFISNAKSDIFVQAGSDSWVTSSMRNMDRMGLLAAPNWIEKNLVYPFSRMVLLFLNYGVFNVLENGLRSVFAGINPFIPRDLDTTRAWIQMSGNLEKAPIGFRLGAMDSQLGIIDPIAAVPANASEAVYGVNKFIKGKIPFVTQDISATIGFIPGVRGTRIERWATKIPDSLQSLASWNQMYSRIGGSQQAWYLINKFGMNIEKLFPTEAALASTAFRPLSGRGLEGDIAGKQITNIEKNVTRRMMEGNPDVIENLALSSRTDLTNMKYAYEISEVLTRHPELEQPFQHAIMKAAPGWQSQADVTDFMNRLFASWSEASIIGKAASTQIRMRDAFEQLGAQAPKTPDEVISFAKEVQDLFGAMTGEQGVMSNLYEMMIKRGDELSKTSEIRTMWTEGTELVQSMTDDVVRQMNFQLNALEDTINGTRRVTLDHIRFDVVEGVEASTREMLPNLPRSVRESIRQVKVGSKPGLSITDGILTVTGREGTSPQALNDMNREVYKELLALEIERDNADEFIEGILSFIDENTGDAWRSDWGTKTFVSEEALDDLLDHVFGRTTLRPGGIVDDVIKQIEKCPQGECFRNARIFAQESDVPGTIVVHGQVTDTNGNRIAHSWVEQGDIVIDTTAGVRTNRATYYRETKAVAEQAYSKIQSVTNALRTGNEGPWTAAEVGNRISVIPTAPTIQPDRIPSNSGAQRFLEQSFPARTAVVQMETDFQNLMLDWINLERSRTALWANPATSPTIAQIEFHQNVFVNKGGLFKNLTKGQRDSHYVTQLQKVRDSWNNYKNLSTKLFYDQQDLARRMAVIQGGDPNPLNIRRPVTGKLSPADVAYLWAGEYAHVDNMVSAMIDTANLTIQSKDDFIRFHMEKAARSAGSESPSQFGFTIESVGDVYDNLMRSLSLDPGSIERFTPAQEMFRGITQEMQAIYTTHAVSDGAVDILNGWYKDVASNMRATGLYNKTPSVDHIPNALRNEDGSALILYHGRATNKVAIEGVDVTRSDGFLGQGFYTDTETGVANNFSVGGDDIAPNRGLMASETQATSTPVVLAPKNLVKAEDAMDNSTAVSMIQDAADRFKNAVPDSASELQEIANGWLSRSASAGEDRNLYMVHAAIKDMGTLQTKEFELISDSLEIGQTIREVSLNHGIDAVSSPNIVDDSVSIWSGAVNPGSSGTVANSGREFVAYTDDIVISQFDEKLLTGNSKWDNIRESSMDETVLNFSEDFPDYTNQNAADQLMRSFYPFWTYETQRWPWIIRNSIQKPGSLATWGRYENATDGGYIAIPGTDLQINPLRGTVWMGGLRRLYQRDFPEYADQFEQPVEMLDTFSRWGFYPGFHIGAPQALFGAKSRGAKPQVGELLPPWATTMLSAITNVAPNSAWANTLTEQIFPDRFRDYRTNIAVTDAGGDGLDLLTKIRANIELTPAESEDWASARQRVLNLGGVLDAQFGLFRFRPPEMELAYAASQQGISELTGLPIEVQEQFQDRFGVTGKRYLDVFPLDPLEQYVMREVLEKNKKWLRSNIAPLLPSVQGDIAFKTTSYFNELEKMWTSARTDGFFGDDGNLQYKSLDQLQQEWEAGTISVREWETAVQATQQQAIIRAQGLGDIDYYRDVPKTRDQREDFFQRFDIPIPTYSAGQELLWAYYDIRPKLEPDENGVNRINWERYFLEIDILLETMLPTERNRLLTRIQADWTDSQRLRWKDSADYLRAYKNVPRVTKAEFTPEQQDLIDEFLRSDAATKERIRAEELTDDGTLIAEWERKTQNIRRNLRLTNHTLDAKLLFWGEVQKPLTMDARKIANKLLTLHRPGAELFTVDIE